MTPWNFGKKNSPTRPFSLPVATANWSAVTSEPLGDFCCASKSTRKSPISTTVRSAAFWGGYRIEDINTMLFKT